MLAPKESTVCFEMEKFVSEERPKEVCPEVLKSATRKNKTVCCGPTSLVLDNLILKTVSERYDSDTNPELLVPDLTAFNCDVIKSTPPIVKLVGISDMNNPALVGTASKIFWNSISPTQPTSGLKYQQDDGMIHVKTSGLYFVSSQIKLQLEPINSTEDNINTFGHSVQLISNDDIVSTVLESLKTRCEIASEKSEFTSSVGAVFRLNAGERLYVATSHPRRLVTNDKASFFNIHGIT